MLITHRYRAPVDEPIPGKLLEIETTGLRPARGRVAVISVAEVRENELHTTQWIAASEEDEGALLTRALPVLAEHPVTVFHAPFLIPFLSERAERSGLVFQPGRITDLRTRFLERRPFYPLEKTSRNAIAETLGLPLPAEPDGEDLARLILRLYKGYDKTIAERIAAHNLLHIRALYGMVLFVHRWDHWLTRTHPFFAGRFRLQTVERSKDFLTAVFLVKRDAPSFLSNGPCELTVENRRARLRIEIKEGMITETMPCTFTEIFDFPALKDRTGFRVPKGVLLLQVEDKYLPESLFDLLEALLEVSGSLGGTGFAVVGHEDQHKQNGAH